MALRRRRCRGHSIGNGMRPSGPNLQFRNLQREEWWVGLLASTALIFVPVIDLAHCVQKGNSISLKFIILVAFILEVDLKMGRPSEMVEFNFVPDRPYKLVIFKNHCNNR